MDENRARYKSAKEIWLSEIEEILNRLSLHDPTYYTNFRPKDTISRINNNRRFNKELPLYKHYFTFSVMDKSDHFSPIHISVGPGSSFVGCGYHNPDKDMLKKIRDAIDYNGEVLLKILQEPGFHNFFGGLSDYAKKLKTSPKGFSNEHPFVELLRYKSFIISKDLSEEEVIGSDFIEIVEKSYVLSKPFREYLKEAGSV